MCDLDFYIDTDLAARENIMVLSTLYLSDPNRFYKPEGHKVKSAISNLDLRCAIGCASEG